MIAVDTSIAVAAALPWHEAHGAARSVVSRSKTALLAQVGVETYSVLTRLPPPQRVTATLARAYLVKTFAFPPITLSGAGYDRLLELAAVERIIGGAIYDALVGATAREAEATLISLDRLAVATYQRLGVDYRVIG